MAKKGRGMKMEKRITYLTENGDGIAITALTVGDADMASMAINTYHAKAQSHAALVARVAELEAVLRLSWEHTDDKGKLFLCNCPRMPKLFADASVDPHSWHSTACVEARVALAGKGET